MSEEYEVCHTEFLLRELAENVACFLDVTSLGRLLGVCRKLRSVPSVQRVWKALVENRLFDGPHAKLPLAFDYVRYCREKIIWKYPLSWEKIRPSLRPTARSRSGVARLGEDIILVGGHVRSIDFVRENDIWRFDTNTENFELIQPVSGMEPPKISRLGLESFGDTVYAFGGILQNKKKINTIYSFDLRNKEWSEIVTNGIPPTGRCDPVTCAYESGSKRGILVFGGSQEGLIFPSDIHFFNVDSHTWELLNIENDSPLPRIGSCATVIGDKFYLYGGAFWNKETSVYTQNYNEMWCLHLGKGPWRWEQLPCLGESPSGAPVNLTAIPIGNHLLIEGSMSCNGSFLYDTVTYTWSKVSTANDANYGSATLVGDSVYYLCGYRGHNHARDVIKLPLTHLLSFIESGIVPHFMQTTGEPMEEDGRISTSSGEGMVVIENF